MNNYYFLDLHLYTTYFVIQIILSDKIIASSIELSTIFY